MFRSTKFKKEKNYRLKKFEQKTIKSMRYLIGKRNGYPIRYQSENEDIATNSDNKEDISTASPPSKVNEEIYAIKQISSYFDSLKVSLKETNLHLSSFLVFMHCTRTAINGF